jgi:hypothetical protein
MTDGAAHSEGRRPKTSTGGNRELGRCGFDREVGEASNDGISIGQTDVRALLSKNASSAASYDKRSTQGHDIMTDMGEVTRLLSVSLPLALVVWPSTGSTVAQSSWLTRTRGRRLPWTSEDTRPVS